MNLSPFKLERYFAKYEFTAEYLLCSSDCEAMSIADLLEQYKQVRAESIKWVSGLKDEELDIKGRHPFLGETVIREMIKMLYLHNQLHYRDLKKVLK